MECHICEVRSSVGFCVECHELLCETCGVPCDQCRKISCPTHIHETKSGKALCVGCYAERRAKKEAAKAEIIQRHTKAHREAVDTSFQSLEKAPKEEGEISDEALVVSARTAIEPWKVSLYIAIAGIAFGIVLLIFPNLRHIALGAQTYSTGLLLIMFVLFSWFWAWVGLRDEQFFRDRIKCFYGIGASVACVVLAFITVSSAPAVETVPVNPNVTVRTGSETPEQLERWRENALKRYQQ